MQDIQVNKTSFSSKPFLDFYSKWEEDIQLYHPDFEIELTDMSLLLTLNKEGLLFGIFIYEQKGDEIHVEVDFVIPAFRNLGIGIKFFRQEITRFKKEGFSKIVSIGANKDYESYLVEVGFKLRYESSRQYELNL